MKRCPTCQRTYTDESLTFCLEDGALLLRDTASSSTSSEPPATMIYSAPPDTSSNRGAAPTEFYNATPTQGGTAPGYTAPPPPAWTPQPSVPPAPSFNQQPSFNQPTWGATNAEPPNKFLLGILGGVVMALPSLVPAVQWICCVWAIGGGLLAAALYIKKSPTKVEMGDGALLGAIAGGFGGLINLVAGLPIAYALYGPRGPYTSRDGSMGAIAIVGIFGTLMLVGFAIAGGVLAVQIFEQRKSGMTPPLPPPPTYGGGMSGYR